MEIKELRKGSDYVLSFSILNPDGSTKDLSGTKLLEATLSEYPWVPPIDTLDTEISITNHLEGKVEIQLSAELLESLDSRLYYLELQHENALGQKLNVLVYAISII